MMFSTTRNVCLFLKLKGPWPTCLILVCCPARTAESFGYRGPIWTQVHSLHSPHPPSGDTVHYISKDIPSPSQTEIVENRREPLYEQIPELTFDMMKRSLLALRGSEVLYFMVLKKRTDMISAALQQEVGWLQRETENSYLPCIRHT